MEDRRIDAPTAKKKLGIRYSEASGKSDRSRPREPKRTGKLMDPKMVEKRTTTTRLDSAGRRAPTINQYMRKERPTKRTAVAMWKERTAHQPVTYSEKTTALDSTANPKE